MITDYLIVKSSRREAKNDIISLEEIIFKSRSWQSSKGIDLGIIISVQF